MVESFNHNLALTGVEKMRKEFNKGMGRREKRKGKMVRRSKKKIRGKEKSHWEQGKIGEVGERRKERKRKKQINSQSFKIDSGAHCQLKKKNGSHLLSAFSMPDPVLRSLQILILLTQLSLLV